MIYMTIKYNFIKIFLAVFDISAHGVDSANVCFAAALKTGFWA